MVRTTRTVADDRNGMNEKQRREKREHDEAREIVMHTIDTLLKRYGVALLRKVLKDADATLFRQECRETLANFQANAVPKEVL